MTEVEQVDLAVFAAADSSLTASLRSLAEIDNPAVGGA